MILFINTLYNDLSTRTKSENNNNDNNSGCPKCNNVYPENSRFCNKCGCSLQNNEICNVEVKLNSDRIVIM